MNRGDIGENYVAVHYDNDYTCRIFLYYYYSSRMTTVIAIQSLRNMAGIKRQKQNSTITEALGFKSLRIQYSNIA